MMPPPVIYTVGSSTRTWAEFRDLLGAFAIGALADVRRFPQSTRHPQFTRPALEAAVAAEGRRYVWLGEDLGGFRAGGYESHMATPAFARGLAALEALEGSAVTALMCAERLPWRCHRRFIAAALARRGWRVVHILETDRTWVPSGEEPGGNAEAVPGAQGRGLRGSTLARPVKNPGHPSRRG